MQRQSTFKNLIYIRANGNWHCIAMYYKIFIILYMYIYTNCRKRNRTRYFKTTFAVYFLHLLIWGRQSESRLNYIGNPAVSQVYFFRITLEGGVKWPEFTKKNVEERKVMKSVSSMIWLSFIQLQLQFIVDVKELFETANKFVWDVFSLTLNEEWQSQQAATPEHVTQRLILKSLHIE